LFDWLFGKKERPAPSTGPQPPQPPERQEAPAAVGTRAEPAAPPVQQPLPSQAPALVGPAPPPNGEEPRPAPSEADNLRRWKESGQARAWVEAHQGQWDHQEWLALLAALQRSPYWPMHADAIGLMLEEVKREWLRRN
jgi:hypothetical protein